MTTTAFNKLYAWVVGWTFNPIYHGDRLNSFSVKDLSNLIQEWYPQLHFSPIDSSGICTIKLRKLLNQDDRKKRLYFLIFKRHCLMSVSVTNV